MFPKSIPTPKPPPHWSFCKTCHFLFLSSLPPHCSGTTQTCQPGSTCLCSIQIGFSDSFLDLHEQQRAECRAVKKQLLVEVSGGWPQIFECPICTDCMDPDFTVQVACCGKIMCFDCLLNSLKKVNKCPFCRAGITKEMVKKDESLLNEFQNIYIVDKQKENQQEQKEEEQKEEEQKENLRQNPKENNECSTHKNPLTASCEDCDALICITCLLNDHKSHQVIEIPEKYPKVLSKAGDIVKESKEQINTYKDALDKVKDDISKASLIENCIAHPVTKILQSRYPCELNKRMSNYETQLGIYNQKSNHYVTNIADMIKNPVIQDLKDLHQMSAFLNQQNKKIIEKEKEYETVINQNKWLKNLANSMKIHIPLYRQEGTNTITVEKPEYKLEVTQKFRNDRYIGTIKIIPAFIHIQDEDNNLENQQSQEDKEEISAFDEKVQTYLIFLSNLSPNHTEESLGMQTLLVIKSYSAQEIFRVNEPVEFNVKVKIIELDKYIKTYLLKRYSSLKEKINQELDSVCFELENSVL
ncbi:unnamed protein product [Moneuplotes crassus]|uniref:RING-type domain-containing protein n=1 Tax=Euplotes crassus TaxID=5936 RepID=A0AAD1UGY0_EUPCR|nr:unnamed protein product [Moneuplotes crassus]